MFFPIKFVVNPNTEKISDITSKAAAEYLTNRKKSKTPGPSTLSFC